MSYDVGIPLPSLHRLPLYYRQLRKLIGEGRKVVSSAELGEACNIPAAQVRKDLSYVKQYGRAGIGYDAQSLATHLAEFLGLVNDKEAVLVGVGNLGRALANYPGFAAYGLHIVALFDADPVKVGRRVGEAGEGRTILPIDKLTDLSRRLHIQMGIITVPADQAQSVAEMMIAGGIRVIWNFSPTTLDVPEGVYVQNQDLAAELATLSHRIAHQPPEEIEEGSAGPAARRGAAQPE
jgi:redox-sensing transcriptional repressor